MSDNKSKLPDLNEIGSIAGKFLNDVKKSIAQIIEEYKSKRVSTDAGETVTKPSEEAKPVETVVAHKATGDISETKVEKPADKAPIENVDESKK